MITIGPHTLKGRAVLAPMAGVTDVPFRKLCRRLGAAMTAAEMSGSNPALRDTLKSQLRRADPSEAEPRVVQIVGTEPTQMAEAARHQAAAGAQIIDINMGCPAKKVCRKLAGSALLKDEQLVADILNTVVAAVEVPVTLKIRTGWSPAHRNAVAIAKLAESCGIQSLAVHGRTRACRFNGQAEYDTIADIVQSVSIPVFANGDINTAEEAKHVLEYTGAAGVMIGRGAQGKPWIFHEINDLLNNCNLTSELFTPKSLFQRDTKSLERLIINHLYDIHQYYLPYNQVDKRDQLTCSATQSGRDPRIPLSVKMARKHISWYFDQLMRIIADTHSVITEFDKSAERVKRVKRVKSTVVDHHAVQNVAPTFSKKKFDEKIEVNQTVNVLAKQFGDGKATVKTASKNRHSGNTTSKTSKTESAVNKEVNLLVSKTAEAKRQFNRLSCESAQVAFIEQFFGELPQGILRHEHKRLLFA